MCCFFSVGEDKVHANILWFMFIKRCLCLNRYGGWMYNQNLYLWPLCLVTQHCAVTEQEHWDRNKRKGEIKRSEALMFSSLEFTEKQGISYCMKKNMIPSVFPLLFFPAWVNMTHHGSDDSFFQSLKVSLCCNCTVTHHCKWGIVTDTGHSIPLIHNQPGLLRIWRLFPTDSVFTLIIVC